MEPLTIIKLKVIGYLKKIKKSTILKRKVKIKIEKYVKIKIKIKIKSKI